MPQQTPQTRVVIIDTGCANLASVYFAVQKLGYHPVISKDADAILTADKLLLPGVGTASTAMEQLHDRNLVALIKACTQPILGICLGMQLMAEYCEEGNTDTLGVIPDSSVLQMTDFGLPLPHMGWNRVYPKAGHRLFNNIADGEYFYFVHSYAMQISHHTIAQCHYGEAFSAAVQQDNFYGVQFHPERSGKAGAQLLKNFLEM
ncbi:MAG: imidazole glycerol phosphate synthase subunit HisH [Plesiomonas sp.]